MKKCFQIQRTVKLTALVVLLSAFVFGCTKKADPGRDRYGKMDTPAYHVGQGDDALMKGDYFSARQAYNQALSLSNTDSAALSGLAVVKAYMAEKPEISMKTKLKTLEEAVESLEKALENTNGDRKLAARAHNFGVQVYLVLQLPEDTWFEKAQQHFEQSVEIDSKNPAPYFFWARANAKKLNYSVATEMYNKVLNFAGKYEEEANKELEEIQKIQRALPGSRFGAQIANDKEVTRADIAALFISELNLERLYGNANSTQRPGYAVPANQARLQMDALEKYPAAIDISGHPMQQAILKIMGMQIKGLEPDPAHRFHPDQKITRAEFAVMIQDVLIKVIKDEGLATRFIGETSPFPDVREDVWFYNATRTVITRGLMQINNQVTGAFEPMNSVSGADALLTIRNMKAILKAYLR